MRIVVDENIPCAQEAFGPMGEVRLVAGRFLGREDVEGADALVVRSVTRVGRDLLEGTGVRFVGTATIGVDHVDVDYLRQAGIGFASAAGCNARSVVEYVVAALLEIALAEGRGLQGRTLGIVGCGNIGGRLSEVAPLLGLRVLLNDPPLERAGRGGPYVGLEELLAESDFVSLHVPKVTTGPDRTIGLIDEERLEGMRRTAWLINTSRGDVVEGDALHDAIVAGRIAGAVLDVWENEPGIDRALLDVVFVGTPHVAGYSLEGKLNGTVMMHDALAGHFGLRHEWRPEMEPVEGASAEIGGTNGTMEELGLAPAVRGSYAILADDGRLRAGRGLEETQWRLHFDRLRREYPVRREFASHTVVVDGRCRALEQKLSGLGFRIERRA
jgi:erythronate-4-phosphate dehydrogenase